MEGNIWKDQVEKLNDDINMMKRHIDFKEEQVASQAYET